MLGEPLPRCRAQRLGLGRVFQENTHSACQFRRTVRADQTPVLAVRDEFADRWDIGSDDWNPGGHGFEDFEWAAALLEITWALGEGGNRQPGVRQPGRQGGVG